MKAGKLRWKNLSTNNETMSGKRQAVWWVGNNSNETKKIKFPGKSEEYILKENLTKKNEG